MKEMTALEVIVVTLCFCFTLFVSAGVIKWIITPSQPSKPSVHEQAVTACIKTGGIPIMDKEDTFRLEECKK